MPKLTRLDEAANKLVLELSQREILIGYDRARSFVQTEIEQLAERMRITEAYARRAYLTDDLIRRLADVLAETFVMADLADSLQPGVFLDRGLTVQMIQILGWTIRDLGHVGDAESMQSAGELIAVLASGLDSNERGELSGAGLRRLGSVLASATPVVASNRAHGDDSVYSGLRALSSALTSWRDEIALTGQAIVVTERLPWSIAE